MALIHCPDCKREVSSRAHTCPQCAYPIKKLTNLFTALKRKDTDMVRDVLNAGYKADEKNEAGFTPLMIAAASGNDRIVRLLIENGADPEIKNDEGQTALDLAKKEGHEDLIPLLRNSHDNSHDNDEEKQKPTQELLPVKKQETLPAKKEEARGDANFPPVPDLKTENKSDERDVRTTSVEHPPVLPVEPPPLPEDSKPVAVRFIDDLAPVVEDEKYTGPGLICKTCKAQIAAEDIWCASCKAPIIRRYCGSCHQLFPDNCALCPYCQSSKPHRFRYFRNLEQTIAGAAILGILIFVISIYSSNDGSKYGEKLAQKRAEQQEQVDIAAETESKKLTQERLDRKATKSSTTPAVVRVVPRETEQNDVVTANGTSDTPNRIPTVERIEVAPSPAPSKEDRDPKEDRQPNAGKPVEKPKPEIIETRIERPAPEPPKAEQTDGSVELARRLNEQGFRLMKNGRYVEAIPVLAQAVRTFPPGKKNLTYAYSLYNLGRSLRLAGRPDLAIPILEERMRFADQRHIVARELEQARRELNGSEPIENVDFE